MSDDANLLREAERALLRPPPVDSAIPLDGFQWDSQSRQFVDPATGYTFEPATNVFMNQRTRHEYVYDKETMLFRPRAAKRTVPDPLSELFSAALSERFKLDSLRQLSADLSHGLQQDISSSVDSSKDAISGLIGQLTRRFGGPHLDEADSEPGLDPAEGKQAAEETAPSQLRGHSLHSRSVPTLDLRQLSGAYPPKLPTVGPVATMSMGATKVASHQRTAALQPPSTHPMKLGRPTAPPPLPTPIRAQRGEASPRSVVGSQPSATDSTDGRSDHTSASTCAMSGGRVGMIGVRSPTRHWQGSHPTGREGMRDDAADAVRDAAALGAELDAAREALTAMRSEHQQELIAVRQGWRSRWL